VPRTDVASRIIDTSTESAFAALVDPDALLQWLPPSGMRGRFEHFDPRPGGGYTLVLTYDDPSGSPGKSTENTDVVEARFVEIEPGVRVVQAIDFQTDDPAFGGTMTMIWEVLPVENGARVEIRAENVPDGVSAEDHAVGLASSLDNLAAYLKHA
jgi:uncharacterized protein YndB with AHSA1/START domain